MKSFTQIQTLMQQTSLTPKTQRRSSMKTELLFDLESTGLLRQGSTIHCIVMRNMASVDEAEVFDHQPERAVIQGVKALERADVLIGHNIVGYDIPLLKEQFPDFNQEVKSWILLYFLGYIILTLLIETMKDALKECLNVSTAAQPRSLGLPTKVF